MLLGIDIGTTKTAAVIVDAEGGVLAAASHAHGAALSVPAGRAEQDPAQLLHSAWAAVGELPADLRRAVSAVGLTGQMHSVVLLDRHGDPLTPLITWQDGRCLEEPRFLPELEARIGYALRTGYGCASIVWRQEHGGLPAGTACAADMPDLAGARLCGLACPPIDPTFAASWGLFDLAVFDWDCAAVAKAGIPKGLLPEVRPSGATAGVVTPAMAQRLGIPAGTSVAVAVGDNQASLLATLGDPVRDIALTLGTAGQLSVVVPRGEQPAPAGECAPWEYRPYPGGRLVLVAAALCGGAAWAWLVDSYARCLREMGQAEPDREWLFARMDELGRLATEELTVETHFLGERHDEGLRGAIRGIDLRNFGMGPLARGLARGIVRNLREMLPEAALAGRTRVVGSGNALRRSALLRSMVESEFRLPLVMAEGREEAATGAARLAAESVRGA